MFSQLWRDKLDVLFPRSCVHCAGNVEGVSAALNETEDGVFIVPLQPRPRGPELGTPCFGELMTASCTRRANFDAVLLPAGALIYVIGNSIRCGELFAFQRAWLHLLTAAA